MGKYDIYIENLKKEESFYKEQDRLHNKHSDIDENKVIVEKSNTIKFVLSFLRASIKTIATIILVSLATIGIITLIYPEIRAEFIEVILNIFNEGKKMI